MRVDELPSTIAGVRYGDIPWAHISLTDFIRHAIETNDTVILTARRRPDVQSRRWYTLEWTGADGDKHYAEASSIELLMDRAAIKEMESIAREDGKWQDKDLPTTGAESGEGRQ